MSLIYRTKGAAEEYCPNALNMPWACPHGCWYCYARRMRQRFPNLNKFHTLDDFYRRLEAELELMRSNKKERLQKEKVLLSFMTDPYPNFGALVGRYIDLTNKVTMLLREHEIPYIILSKGALGSAQIAAALGCEKGLQCEFWTTLTYNTMTETELYEPCTATPKERKLTLQLAHNNGVATAVSLEPIISIELAIQHIKDTVDYVDKFLIGKMSGSQKDEYIPGQWREFCREAKAIIDGAGKEVYFKKSLQKQK